MGRVIINKDGSSTPILTEEELEAFGEEYTILLQHDSAFSTLTFTTTFENFCISKLLSEEAEIQKYIWDRTVRHWMKSGMREYEWFSA